MSNPPLSAKGRSNTSFPPLAIAVEGCGHGSLDYIYETLEKSCHARGWTVANLDFLIICGDFQAFRNEQDLNCMSAPRRYRTMGDFHRYYSGEKKAPVLTLVIGGNHEASSYLSELCHGGWLAPNIYYLGSAGVVRYGPYRIAGLSGIYHASDYRKPHHERLPYDQNEVRSIYHVRECDVAQLLQVCSPIDIGISHDWPRRVEWYGDYQKLFADRPHFFESAKKNRLGSAPAEQVMMKLRPRYWFSGHMHVKFSANVRHEDETTGDIFTGLTVPEEIRKQLPKSMFKAPFNKMSKPPKSSPSDARNDVTRFLALSKPGSDREFLELLEIPASSTLDNASPQPHTEPSTGNKLTLCYDEEWLAIVRSTHTLSKTKPRGPDASAHQTMLQNLRWIQSNLTAKGPLEIPNNFKIHAPTYTPKEHASANEQPCQFPNSQTSKFRALLQIPDEDDAEEDMADGEDYIVFA